MSERRSRRVFSEEFKKQITALYNAGKPKIEIQREYNLSYSVVNRWITRINNTGSSTERANRSPESQQLLDLTKENQQLKMENDILKQAALIMAQK